MPRPTPHLFISATTLGLKQYREQAGRALHEKGIFADSQEVFGTDYRTIREKLKDTISKCDGVICLIGPYYGVEPKDRDDAAPRRSYTQLEFYIAQELGKPIYRFFAEGCPEFADVEAEPAELAELQKDFIAQVRLGEEIHYTFTDNGTLRDLIFRIAVPPHDPQRKPQNLPYPSLGKLFKGREALLSELHDLMHDPAQRCIAVHGLGGVGKTRLAVEYAFRNAAEYAALLFIVADTPEALRRNLAALCGPLVLNLAEREEKEEEVRVNAALRWFQENRGWLLIIDNVDTSLAASAVEELLGSLQQGHVLITSRLTDWSSAVACLGVDVLSEDAATEFLLERTEDRRRKTASDHSEARKLAKDLEYLALALEQAGAFISQKRCSFAEYRQRWRIKDKIVRNWSDARLMKYPRSVAGTWLTTMQQLTPPAKDLLRTLSWFDSEPIPRTLLPTAELLDALAELCSYSLVKVAGQGEQFRILGLVQEVTRDHQKPEEQSCMLQRALQLLDFSVPAMPQDVRNWPLWEMFRPHVAAVTTYADSHGIQDPTTKLMNELALLLYSKGLHRDAKTIMRRALEIDEDFYGCGDPMTSIRLSNLAQILVAGNELVEAERLMRQALLIDEKHLGASHPNVATELNNLAQLLNLTNRVGDAEPLMWRVLGIDEETYGSDHPKVAIRLNNLAALLSDTNRFTEAEPLMRRALAIDVETYGANHPEVARDLNNLGQLLHTTNRLEEAENLLQRAVAIVEEAYGSQHPRVALYLNNLALLLKDRNRLEEVEPLIRRAIAIQELFYGLDHPAVAAVIGNLAQLLVETNRLREAEPLMRRALAIDEKSYGPQHPTVARDLNNLALLLETKQSGEAENLLQRALAIDEHSFGNNHPNVAIRLVNLASLLVSKDRLAEAEPLLRRALSIDEKSYGPDHPDVAIDLNNLAHLLHSSGRGGEALELIRRAITIAENAYGPDHPTVLTLRRNLAGFIEGPDGTA